MNTHPHDIMNAEAVIELDKLVEQAREESEPKREKEFVVFNEWVKSND